ncbi:MAG: DEAD/DEAH box helicase [bacterium]|nr:DEAD/DEAH box helicase [bacterium]
MTLDYDDFLDAKRQLGGNNGFDPVYMPDFLFDFQKSLVEWAVKRGRAAIFAGCGMGKTPMQLSYAENVVRHTGGNVLILAPLAVSAQTVREAEKFGIDCARSRDGKPHGKITITNYQQLHNFDPSDYVGVVCDESSILKSFNGALRGDITKFMRKIPYRLLATATPSPNDYIELGTSSEALGYLGATDMLNKFFVNDQGNSKTGRHMGETLKWRLKGHAETPFWRWVCSWARAISKPSDIGFDDAGFILPEMIVKETIVEAKALRPGTLFTLSASNLQEQREERRRTMPERCEAVAEKVNDTGESAIAWCHLNDEGDLLEKLIPDAVQVSGKDNDERQEEKFMAFIEGQARVLVTKPKIGAWGLNLQHCSHMTIFPSHSFEQYYQSVRRCWRFGQANPVVIDIIASEGESLVIGNLQRKQAQAEKMFAMIVAEMNNATNAIEDRRFNKTERIPAWLS